MTCQWEPIMDRPNVSKCPECGLEATYMAPSWYQVRDPRTGYWMPVYADSLGELNVSDEFYIDCVSTSGERV